MTEQWNPFAVLLLINSILIIGLILNQNESTKDSAKKDSQSSSSNPLENITWFCTILELVLLLVQIKTINT